MNITNNINIINNNSFISDDISIDFNYNHSIIYKKNSKILLDNYESLHINNPVYISTKNHNKNIGKNSLYVDGNVNIIGNLLVNKINNFFYNPKEEQLQFIENINTINIKVKDLIHINGFTYTDHLDSDYINIDNSFILPKRTDNIVDSTYPQLYYNKTTQKYMIYNNFLANPYHRNLEVNNTRHLLDYTNVNTLHTNSASDITLLHSDNIITDTLNHQTKLNIDNSSIYYNVTLNREEININDTLKYFDIMYDEFI